MEALAILRMLDANAHYHLRPIVMSGAIERLWIVRPVSPAGFQPVEKAVYREAKGRTVIGQLWNVYRESLTIARRPEVRAIVSFNAVPYGLIALLVGWRTQKPVHLGFVGDDWYRYCRGFLGAVLHFFFRNAWFITVTGESMKREMIQRGYDPDKIAHLPHAVDVDRFSGKPVLERNRTCIFVGNLIPRKRVDLIISAMNIVCKKYPHATLQIIGDGPVRPALERQVSRLELAKNILFTGWQRDPAPLFCDSHITVMASDREGFPFALVEGMCAGAVPVSTDVGTIREFVAHGRTGFLVPRGDALALAGWIIHLLEDHSLYETVRANILAVRDRYRFDRAVSVWSEQFERHTQPGRKFVEQLLFAGPV